MSLHPRNWAIFTARAKRHVVICVGRDEFIIHCDEARAIAQKLIMVADEADLVASASAQNLSSGVKNPSPEDDK